MRDMFKKIRDSEFLSNSELLQLKVSVVMLFLLVFGLLTIPISIVEDFGFTIRIIVPLVFSFLFLLTFLMLVFNKPRIAMHLSIYIFIGLTLYYVGESGQFYSYFLFFITLTIIIFYQDISTYIVYGGALTIYGLIYIHNAPEIASGVELLHPELSPLIYQFILAGFFLIFLVYFILTDSINEHLTEDYLKTQKSIERYRSMSLRQSEEIDYSMRNRPIHEDIKLEQTVKRISALLMDKLSADGSDSNADIDNLEEIVEFYFYLHKRDLKKILDDSSVSLLTKKYTVQLSKYLLDRDSELNAIQFDVAANFIPPLEHEYKRYKSHINELFYSKTNRIIALCIIYKFLRTEITQYDKWGRVAASFEHEDIKRLFQSKSYRSYISFADMNFFLQNESLFKRHLR